MSIGNALGHVAEGIGIFIIERLIEFGEWMGGLICKRKGHDFESWRCVELSDGQPYEWRFCNRCNALETNFRKNDHEIPN